MKDAILAEIQLLEQSENLLDRKRGRTIRLVLESIRCVTCLDTRRYWKFRDGLPWSALDLRGYYDVMGCSDCSDGHWIACSITSDLREHDIRVYHKENRDAKDRMYEMYAVGVRDRHLMEEVERWLFPSAPSASQTPSSSLTPVTAVAPPAEPASESKPLFKECQRLLREYREETTEGELEVGKIVNTVKQVVEAYFGDVFSLAELCAKLTVSFQMSDTQSINHDKLIMISNNNYLGIKTCTKVTDQKLSLGFMKGSRYAKEYSAEIFILQPLNQPAVEKAEFIMSKIATDVMEEILESF